jgi:hypothetical protein
MNFFIFGILNAFTTNTRGKSNREPASLCNLCVLCVSVVGCHKTTTETQRTQSLHRGRGILRDL